MNSSVTNKIKIAALVLCAAILLALFAGDVFSGSSLPGDVFAGPGVDFAAAMKTFSPDKKMVYTDGLAITWDMYYFFLFDTGAQVSYGFQGETDWHEIGPNGDTLSEVLVNFAADQAVQALVYEYGVNLFDVSLSEEELETIDSYIAAMIEEAGSIEALEKDLRENGFFSLDGFEKLMRSFSLQAKLPIALYGETYSDISDDIVAGYAQREGYMLAKHILRRFPLEQEGLSQQETEDAKVSAYNEAAAILEELNAHINDDNFVDFFSSLEREHSEDPGSLEFPGGYLFLPGDMVPEFESACQSLEYGQISGIVESSFGYHIILRLPLDYDNVLSFSQYSQGQNATLRQLAVLDDFDNKYYQWLDSMSIEFSPDLDSLDLGVLFAWQE